ncbi:MAG: hypothetical protein KAI47_20670, partial [Deltaproteobacteria bacterium]|nr:hypothetical protein [Deltaproteobacteria bacterium]
MLLTAAFGGGCLLLESVNHRPRAEITVESAAAAFHRGERVLLKASVDDEDEGATSLVLAWEVVFRGAETSLSMTRGGALVPISTLVPVSTGDGGSISDGRAIPEALAILEAGDGPELVVPLPQDDRLGGTYTAEITLRARDPQGAEAYAHKILKIVNRAPKVRIVLIDAEPPPPLLFRHNIHVASGAASLDPDDTSPGASGAGGLGQGDLACGVGKVETRWEAVSPPKSAFAFWRVLPCRPGQVLDKLAWRLPSSRVSTKVTLRIVVRDRWGAEARTERTFTVGPDATPCIDGTTPAFATDGKAPAKVAIVTGDGDAPAMLVVEGITLTLDQGTTTRDVPEGQVYRWLVATRPEGP